jgi:glycogen synthase
MRSVSIVVNTLDRADSLRRTLHSLRQLNYPEIEVVVVVGPSSDHTESVVSEFEGQIKVGWCDQRNLSTSRNIGLSLASGELLAFIDDDSVADPWWLDEVTPAFEDAEVAAAGGPVYDFDGVALFSRYSLTDVHGDTAIWKDGPNPSRLVAAPLSDLVVYPIGTNAVFRRSVIVDLGGFDEEYGHYFDDADMGFRLVERGWVVQACDAGFVYHLRLPSATRTPERITRNLFPYLRSRAYFAFRHARPRVGLVEVSRRYESAVERFRQDHLWCIGNGLLETADLEQFERDAPRAVDEGCDAAREGPKVRAPAWFERDKTPFLRLRDLPPNRRLHVCIVTQEYLPSQLNGIGRLSRELAVALADRSHVVRIVTEAQDNEGVDIEDGVWVHRVVARRAPAPVGVEAPSRIWNFSTSVLDALRRIREMHAIDAVQIPNWNSEGIAVLEDGSFTTVLGLHTPLKTIARIDPRLDPRTPEVRQLIALELRCYERATAYLACGPESLRQIEEEYDIEVPRERVGVVPFGISDRRNTHPVAIPGRLNVLFVGRLEARKGIDTLLGAAAALLPEIPEIAFTIVGNDTIPSATGRTYREEFERSTDVSMRDGRVFFTGVAPDDELDRYYAGCDIFVAPSVSESFGLILLEAMREAKPVVAGDVGGMREIIEHEGNGLLVPPGSVDALSDALRRLAKSESLRERYGRRSRELFERRYTAARMAQGYEQLCLHLVNRTR